MIFKKTWRVYNSDIFIRCLKWTWLADRRSHSSRPTGRLCTLYTTQYIVTQYIFKLKSQNTPQHYLTPSNAYRVSASDACQKMWISNCVIVPIVILDLISYLCGSELEVDCCHGCHDDDNDVVMCPFVSPPGRSLVWPCGRSRTSSPCPWMKRYKGSSTRPTATSCSR